MYIKDLLKITLLMIYYPYIFYLDTYFISYIHKEKWRNSKLSSFSLARTCGVVQDSQSQWKHSCLLSFLSSETRNNVHRYLLFPEVYHCASTNCRKARKLCLLDPPHPHLCASRRGGGVMNNKYGDKRMKLGNQFTAKYLHILLKETVSEIHNRAWWFLFWFDLCAPRLWEKWRGVVM